MLAKKGSTTTLLRKGGWKPKEVLLGCPNPAEWQAAVWFECPALGFSQMGIALVSDS